MMYLNDGMNTIHERPCLLTSDSDYVKFGSVRNGPQLLKDYRYHDFPNTEFFYFLTIDTRQYELSNYLLKNGGHRPLKGRYDVLCNDVIFH